MKPNLDFLYKEVDVHEKRFSFKKIIRFALKLFFVFIVFSIICVFLLKWINPPFTQTMWSKSIGSTTGLIYYDWVNYEEIPDNMKLAVIASEDQRFLKHHGFDWRAIFYAIKNNRVRVRKGLKPRGASTISQQVAKNVFLWQSGGYFRKGLEAYYTLLVELFWGKRRILEVYLNIAEMGPQTFGIQAAAKRYFHKNARDMTKEECALIAAVLPNPVFYSAKKPNAYVLKRRKQILRQMKLLGGTRFLKGI